MLRPRNGLSLCAGGGGLDLGLGLAEPGFATRCFVEIEPAARDVLVAGMRAGYLDEAPIWDDLETFDARPFRGAFDTVLAGYPCQPFSTSGKRQGPNDERHLWPHVARVIGELDPAFVLLENVEGHVSLGLELVLRELRGMGYEVAAGLFSAEEVGASHERARVFVVAYSESRARELYARQGPEGQGAGDAGGLGLDVPGSASLADSCGAGREGGELGRACRSARSRAHGSTSERRDTWLFPPARPRSISGASFSPAIPSLRPLLRWMISAHGRKVARRLWRMRARPRLNPLFVERLMGWPPGHALCDCSATEFALWRRRMRGALSALPLASGPFLWIPPIEADRPAEQLDLFGAP